MAEANAAALRAPMPTSCGAMPAASSPRARVCVSNGNMIVAAADRLCSAATPAARHPCTTAAPVHSSTALACRTRWVSSSATTQTHRQMRRTVCPAHTLMARHPPGANPTCHAGITRHTGHVSRVSAILHVPEPGVSDARSEAALQQVEGVLCSAGDAALVTGYWRVLHTCSAHGAHCGGEGHLLYRWRS